MGVLFVYVLSLKHRLVRVVLERMCQKYMKLR